jgi:hypothetical protein
VRSTFNVGDEAAHVRVELVEVEFEHTDALAHQYARCFGGFKRVPKARHNIWRGASEVLARRFSVGHLRSAFPGGGDRWT